MAASPGAGGEAILLFQFWVLEFSSSRRENQLSSSSISKTMLNLVFLPPRPGGISILTESPTL